MFVLAKLVMMLHLFSSITENKNIVLSPSLLVLVEFVRKGLLLELIVMTCLTEK